MYISKHFKNTDHNETIAFMRKYSFGTIITAINNLPFATHLPFIIEQKEETVFITSHFAKANLQANQLNGEVLVIFNEPHAYVSPRFYEKEQNVPTWNYIAVHAYGKASIIATKDDQLQMMEQMILNYDAPYLSQWNGLNDEFKNKMLNGIVAFQIRVTLLEAKHKLSQNRSQTERAEIINTFETSNDANEIQIAEYMKNR